MENFSSIREDMKPWQDISLQSSTHLPSCTQLEVNRNEEDFDWYRFKIWK